MVALIVIVVAGYIVFFHPKVLVQVVLFEVKAFNNFRLLGVLRMRIGFACLPACRLVKTDWFKYFVELLVAVAHVA